MTSELRKFIELTFELILLGAIVTIAVLSANVGKASLNAYVIQQEARSQMPEVVEYTKGSVGYYELVDLIDSYAPTTEIIIKYKDQTYTYRTITFTLAIDGKTVQLALGDIIPERGVHFTGVVYGRQDGNLYKNGVKVLPQVLESDMNLPLGSFRAMNVAQGGLAGNSVLDYNFIELLFEWAKDERFICTVIQTYETEHIDSIVLQMQ